MGQDGYDHVIELLIDVPVAIGSAKVVELRLFDLYVTGIGFGIFIPSFDPLVLVWNRPYAAGEIFLPIEFYVQRIGFVRTVC